MCHNAFCILQGMTLMIDPKARQYDLANEQFILDQAAAVLLDVDNNAAEAKLDLLRSHLAMCCDLFDQEQAQQQAFEQAQRQLQQRDQDQAFERTQRRRNIHTSIQSALLVAAKDEVMMESVLAIYEAWAFSGPAPIRNARFLRDVKEALEGTSLASNEYLDMLVASM
jgi:multidrug efflux pump subunit AcrA (membrane-fusion protein)